MGMVCLAETSEQLHYLCVGSVIPFLWSEHSAVCV